MGSGRSEAMAAWLADEATLPAWLPARPALLTLDARECDARLRAWHAARGLQARVPWYNARWLRRCDRDLVADAAAWLKQGEGAGALPVN